MNLLDNAVYLIKDIETFELSQQAQRKSKEMLEKSVVDYQNKLHTAEENLEIALSATTLLQSVSTSSVQQSYKFIEDNINPALQRIFPDRVRIIKFEETSLRGYPQLNLDLIVEGGIKRSLSYGSGHGIAQIISILCTLCLIVIRGGRRLVVLDEVMSGMDADTRRTFEGIMQDFTTIGFQFICVEHGFAPPIGANVVHLAPGKGYTVVDKQYIQTAQTQREFFAHNADENYEEG